MGTTSLSASGDANLYSDLKEAIRKSGYDNPSACAGAILTRHFDSRVLLGILAGGKAVYYSTVTRCVAAVPFNTEVADLSAARPLTQSIDDIDSWVIHCGDNYQWEWRHPQFR